MLAAFPEDGPSFGEPITWAGHLHGVGFVCIVLFGMTGMVATAVALRRNMAWRGYSAISVIAAVAAFCLLLPVCPRIRSRDRDHLGVYGYFAVTVFVGRGDGAAAPPPDRASVPGTAPIAPCPVSW